VTAGAGQKKVFAETESCFANGSTTPIVINWRYGQQFAALGIYAAKNGVTIDNTAPVSGNGVGVRNPEVLSTVLKSSNRAHRFFQSFAAYWICPVLASVQNGVREYSSPSAGNGVRCRHVPICGQPRQPREADRRSTLRSLQRKNRNGRQNYRLEHRGSPQRR
jgi:hypothetical protein